MSPDYETASKFIPAVGSATGVPAVQGTNRLYFNLFLPSGAAPAGGWPVAIFGHGFGDNKNSSPTLLASSMARRGIATIAINVVGHGGGPLGTLTVNRTAARRSRSRPAVVGSIRTATARSTAPRASTRPRRRLTRRQP